MQSTLRDIHAQRLLILDFGSQYTQLIARRVRECGVYCEIYPFDICLLYTSPSPRDATLSRMPSSA